MGHLEHHIYGGEKLNPIAIVPGLGELFYKEAPLDKSYESFRSSDADLLRIGEVMYSRCVMNEICSKTDRLLNNNALLTREGWVHDPQENISILIRKSYIITKGTMHDAIDAHAHKKEYNVSTDLMKAFNEAHTHRYFVLSDFAPRKLIKDDDLIGWITSDDKENMIKKIYDSGTREIEIIAPKNTNQSEHGNLPFIGQMYIGETYGGKCSIGMAGRILHHSHPTFAIKK